MTDRGALVLRLAVLALFAAVTVQVYLEFGDSAFTRTLAGIVVAVLVAAVAWWYVALPLLAWRRGRWPLERIELDAVTGAASWPLPVKRRIEALEPLGFTPRLVHARAEGNAAATIVILGHAARDVYASVARMSVGKAEFCNTRIMTRPGLPDSLVVMDAVPPSPFPRAPRHRVLLFPGADAAALVAYFDRLHPARDARPPLPDAELAAAMATAYAAHDRWLLDAGYIAASGDGSVCRYTLKGGFSAVLRPLWPWHAIERARHAGKGRQALRAASQGTA